MSRFGYLTRHPKRSLGALSTLLVAAGLTVGSGAFFQDTDTTGVNSVAAGTVDIAMHASSAGPAVDATTCSGATLTGCNLLGTTNAASNGASFTISKLTPTTNTSPINADNSGTAEAGVIRRAFAVENKGNVPVHLKLRVKDIDNTQGTSQTANDALLGAVRLRIDRVDPSTNAKISRLTATNDLDTFGSLLNPFQADTNASALRDEIAPASTVKYVATMWLPDSGADQSTMQAGVFTANIEAIARSLDSSGS